MISVSDRGSRLRTEWMNASTSLPICDAVTEKVGPESYSYVPRHNYIINTAVLYELVLIKYPILLFSEQFFICIVK